MSDATDYIERLRAERDAAQVALMRQSRRAEALEQERDQARADAKTLASAITEHVHQITSFASQVVEAWTRARKHPNPPRRSGPEIEVKR